MILNDYNFILANINEEDKQKWIDILNKSFLPLCNIITNTKLLKVFIIYLDSI